MVSSLGQLLRNKCSEYALSIERIEMAQAAYYYAAEHGQDYEEPLALLHEAKAEHRARYGAPQKREGVWS